MLAAAWAPSAHGQEVSVFGGVFSSGGRYIFDVPTVSHTITLGASIATPRIGFDVVLPVLLQNSGAITFIGGSPVPTGGPRSGTLSRRQQGERIPLRRGMLLQQALIDSTGLAEAPGPYRLFLGDPLVSLRSAVRDTPSQRIGWSLSAKLPLASPDEGVGTGKLDVGAGLDFSFTSGRSMLLVDLSHWVLGDLPELPLRDVSGAGIGVGRVFGSDARWSGLLNVSASTPVVSGLEPPVSVSVGVGRFLTGGRSLSLSVGAGLTESTAAWTVGLSWRLLPSGLGAVP